MKRKERLDKMLVDKGLVKSREMAKSLIMEGKVMVEGVNAVKPGTMVYVDSDITLKGEPLPYVSRGGVKLAAALVYFGIDTRGKITMDVGCSTGGFTDCLLQRGAAKVFAIDVGYGQFDWALRNDPRVALLEKTNIRYLGKEAIPDPIDLAVIDVSFISLLKVLPVVLTFLAGGGLILALVKPQFEVGRGKVGKGGIVKDEAARIAAVEEVRAGAELIGLRVMGVCESPIRGQKGHVEYFISMEKANGRA